MGPLQRLCAGLAVTASTVLAGCILFTGGTGGYVAADAGAGSGGSCKVASDCPAGQVCCYDLEAGVPTLGCSSSCVAYAQACAVASDCAPREDGGVEAGASSECISQACSVEGIASATVSTCAPIPFCSQ
ncbi:MAG TPA: hypothetical protein VIY73_28705 [Polyangiaceae bacterium]